MTENVLFPIISLQIQSNTCCISPHAIFLEPDHADISTATPMKRNRIIVQNIKENMRSDFCQQTEA
jgi:hypothetical protein